MKTLLPLGSVIKLKKSVSQIMVIGYYPLNKVEKKIYCYLGTNYIFGVGGNKDGIMFDSGDIEEVIYRGYESNEEKQYNQKLSLLIEKSKIVEDIWKNEKI